MVFLNLFKDILARLGDILKLVCEKEPVLPDVKFFCEITQSGHDIDTEIGNHSRIQCPGTDVSIFGILQYDKVIPQLNWS